MKTTFIKSISFFFVALLMLSFEVMGQQISGVVKDKDNTSENLIGATVYWLGTTIGTTTDVEGKFKINKNPNAKFLVVSYVGYQNDTLEIKPQTTFLEISLQSNSILESVVVEDTKVLEVTPMQAELLTIKDLQKAACCNLSESFETNASIDVSTSDAVTGTRQIRMLGLDGVYTQMNVENRPSIRGLSARNGLLFIAGTWIKSIDINKGAGSVANGYESITGQINVELAKPENSEKMLFNFYVGQSGRLEANLNLAHQVSKKWSVATLLHASNQSLSNDGNKDGFLDIPNYSQINGINRWKYDGDRLKVQFGVNALYDNRIGGQKEFESRSETPNLYGFKTENTKIEGFTKIGILSKTSEHRSLGIIASGSHLDLNSFWGKNDYVGKEDFFNLNTIFQTRISPTNEVRTGVSYTYNDYKQDFWQNTDSSSSKINFDRMESVVGGYAEFTNTSLKKFTAVLGLRADYHNLYGIFFSPRLHLKYDFSENTILRASAGKGYRVANVIVENTGFLASQRQVEVLEKLNPEIAWNMGTSFSHLFKVGEKTGTLVVDFYRTQFENQVITDLDSDPFKISFYNLKGKSYANSLQVTLDYELAKSLNVNLAYKYYDVKSHIGNTLKEVPFVSKNRFFVNLAYATKHDKWLFDYTIQWHGRKRIPDIANKADHTHNEPHPILNVYSTPYFVMNAQVTRNFKKLAVYAGAENLGNYMQHNPVNLSQRPYDAKFDAGMIWAPIMGRMVYAGLRYKIE